MTLYQKFLDLSGLVHISEADFNDALDPKTDEQKALHDFIKWSVGKTDANPDAAAFRKDFNTTHEDHKADVTDTVLSSPTAPTSETSTTSVVSETSPTVPTPVASVSPVASVVPEEHKNTNDTAHAGTETVSAAPVASEPVNNTVHTETSPTVHATPTVSETVSSTSTNVVTNTETASPTAPVAPDSNVVTSSETESAAGEPSTLVVK